MKTIQSEASCNIMVLHSIIGRNVDISEFYVELNVIDVKALK